MSGVSGRYCPACRDDSSTLLGLCQRHLGRLRRHGSPFAEVRIHGDDEARFWKKVEKQPGPCWIWTGAKNHKGYGQFRVNRHLVSAHKYAYELLVGPVPRGLELDHVRGRGCVHRHCVNPEHLEAVTHAENLRRRAPKGA